MVMTSFNVTNGLTPLVECCNRLPTSSQKMSHQKYSNNRPMNMLGDIYLPDIKVDVWRSGARINYGLSHTVHPWPLLWPCCLPTDPHSSRYLPHIKLAECKMHLWNLMPHSMTSSLTAKKSNTSRPTLDHHSHQVAGQMEEESILQRSCNKAI